MATRQNIKTSKLYIAKKTQTPTMAVLMIKQHVTTALFIMFLIFSLEHQVVNSEPTQDKQALLAFLSQIPHENRLQWNPSNSACSWVGVECDSTNSSVYSLRLPGVGLIGSIPANTLGRLSQLRILSLRSNRLFGPIPPDFSNLTLLRSAYFQSNEFSGEFPTSLTELTRLTRFDISSNNFTGPIPFSVSNLTHLTGLFLHNNGFSGGIPSISLPSLVQFNVSNNHLNGSIPATLSRFPATAFANNLELCGAPLPPCNPFPPTLPPPTPSPNHRRNNPSLSTGAIIGISIAGGIIILLLLLALIFLLIRRKRSKTTKSHKPPPIIASRSVADPGTSSSKDDIPGGSAAERTKLVFVGGGYRFDLEDLLRASAEVLGKGGLGTSYKAVLEEGTTVVVKRLKDVTATKKEFEKEMEVLGNVKFHHNVLPWRAFFYSENEKLLVSDYLNAGSLSAFLHGSRGSGRTPLGWENRLKIAISAARGLTHLHESKIVHGNIKSSNLLLKQENTDSCFLDFGLNPLFSNTTPSNHRIIGYSAPEVIETRKVTFKSDVYSFGVLLLELLTGKSPNQASLGEEGIDLPRWVQSVVREEWTAEVFDVELMRYHNTEEEMVQLLQIGMACVSVAPDQRPDMHEILKMIEEMNKGDSTDDGIRISSDDALRGGSVSPTSP